MIVAVMSDSHDNIENIRKALKIAKKENAEKHANRIRNNVKELEFKTEKGQEVKVTISGGIVSTEDFISENHLAILRAADAALYRSKETGRDKISVFDDSYEIEEAEENKNEGENPKK